MQDFVVGDVTATAFVPAFWSIDSDFKFEKRPRSFLISFKKYNIKNYVTYF